MEIFYMLTPEGLQAADAWKGRPLSWAALLEKSIGEIVRSLGNFSNLNWMEQTPSWLEPTASHLSFSTGSSQFPSAFSQS